MFKWFGTLEFESFGFVSIFEIRIFGFGCGYAALFYLPCIPANPKNAKDISDALIKAMGNPRKGFGKSRISSLSRNPDINRSARVNPTPVAKL